MCDRCGVVTIEYASYRIVPVGWVALDEEGREHACPECVIVGPAKVPDVYPRLRRVTE
jgi:hypothetical protein